MNLLDGSQDTRVYPSVRGIDRIDISDSVEKGTYTLTVNADAEHAVAEGNSGGFACIRYGGTGWKSSD